MHGRLVSAFLAILALAPPAAAQEAGGARSPYAGLESREIKALSASEVEGLLAGEGMGYALAAELNGWPGPKHVLELADPLGLTAEQREKVEAIRAQMGERARSLGAALVEAESELDRLFAGGRAEAREVEAKVAGIARLEGELRAAHLVAHLQTRRTLGEEQVARYVALRGYGSAGPPAHEHGEGHVHEP